MDTPLEQSRSLPERAALGAGGIATLLAGACCLGPLVLVLLGVGGAWISKLQLLEPYRPIFIAAALACLGWGGWRIYRSAACAPGGVCAMPRARRGYRIAFWLLTALFLVVLVFPYFAPLFY